MRRWVCKGCGKGVNAPERMKRDDTRRYCLECSATSSTLVERHCPALEAGKAKRATARKAKTAKRHERNAALIQEYKTAELAAPFRDSDAKIRAEYIRLRRLKAWGRKLSTRFSLRRARIRYHRVTGHCWGSNRITVTVGYEADAAQIKMVLLHELAHAASKCKDAHGPRFRSVFLDGAREAYGIEAVEAHSQIWEFSHAIAEAIRNNEKGNLDV